MITSSPAGGRADYAPPLVFGVVVAASAVILCHLAVVFWLSLYKGWASGEAALAGFANYAEMFGDPFTWRVLVDTLTFSFVTLAVSLFFGLPSAWLVARTDLPGKTLVFSLMVIGLLVPGFTSAMGWQFLLHQRIGLLNVGLVELFGLDTGPIDISSMAGMGWVQGLGLAPLAFVMTTAVFRATDPTLEEAANMSGAGMWAVFRRITLPLCWPGILAAAIYVFTIGFAAFDVPAIIGWGSGRYTFATYLLSIIDSQDGVPDYGLAAALSSAVIVLAVFLGWWYISLLRHARRYEVITGKGYQPRIVALRQWRWPAWAFLGAYFILSKLFPILVLVWAALLPYLTPPSAASLAAASLSNFGNIDWGAAWRGFSNTVFLMVLTPVLTLSVSFAFSWLVLRSRVRWREAFDFIAFVPHAVPNILFALGTMLIALFVLDQVLPIYGTIWVLLLVFVITRVSYATRMTNSSLIQIKRELDESAEMCGAGSFAIMRKILVPLMAPAMIYAGLWTAILTFRELSLAVFLTTSDNLTLPVVIWSIWWSGAQGPAAALSLVMLVAMTPLIASFLSLTRRRGLMESV